MEWLVGGRGVNEYSLQWLCASTGYVHAPAIGVKRYGCMASSGAGVQCVQAKY